MKVSVDDWAHAEALVMPLRIAVFVEEQGVPASIERDDYDAVSRHAWMIDDAGQVVATGRLLPDGHIGRMAVRADCRRRGLGARVLQALIDEAQNRGMTTLVLNAQTHAQDFYRRHGFLPEGEVITEAGLPHQCMRRELD